MPRHEIKNLYGVGAGIVIGATGDYPTLSAALAKLQHVSEAEITLAEAAAISTSLTFPFSVDMRGTALTVSSAATLNGALNIVRPKTLTVASGGSLAVSGTLHVLGSVVTAAVGCNGILMADGESVTFGACSIVANAPIVRVSTGAVKATVWSTSVTGASAVFSASGTGVIDVTLESGELPASAFSVAGAAAIHLTRSVGTKIIGTLPAGVTETVIFDDTVAGDALGLGNAATKDVGTTTGTVAAGDHTHADLHTHANKAAIDTLIPTDAGKVVVVKTGATGYEEKTLTPADVGAAASDHNHDLTYAALSHSQAATTISNTVTALTDGASINTDCATAHRFSVTLAGDRMLENPTNMRAGDEYMWLVSQDATGSRLLSFGTAFNWGTTGTPVLSTAANAVDLIRAYCTGTALYATIYKGF